MVLCLSVELRLETAQGRAGRGNSYWQNDKGRIEMTGFGFWIIQLPGWGLFLYLVVAQCSAALGYDLGVRMGTQEPAERITEVGVAFFKGLAVADLVFYTPLLGLGLAGHAFGSTWGPVLLAAAAGITVYWPVACLVTIKAASGAANWSLPKERDYWIVLPVIAAWGAVTIAMLLSNS